jgi:hypothetical protein
MFDRGLEVFKVHLGPLGAAVNVRHIVSLRVLAIGIEHALNVAV